MLLEYKDMTVSVGGEVILEHTDLTIKGHEKIALVGKNGAGKTTLLRVLSGEITPDRDDKRQGPVISGDKGIRVGQIKQNAFENVSGTVYEIIFSEFVDVLDEADRFSKERYELEVRLDKLLSGFGFAISDKNKNVVEFSGGQKTRLAFVKLLMGDYDLILLDEPTNHLDMAGTEWLEEYLKDYKGAAVIVSHDRFFIDRVADVTVELENKKLKRFTGGYTAYRKEKKEQAERDLKAYLRYEEESKRLNDVINKFKHKPTKAAFARAKKKQLERMEVPEKPSLDHIMQLSALKQPEILGAKWVYEAEKLKVGYDKPLYETDLRIRRGQKIGVIGENGSGKTALLQTIAGIIPKLSGKATLGNQILLGYYDQKSSELAGDSSVLEHFHNLFPGMLTEDVRKTLAMWRFSGRDLGKKVSNLSGGEKSKLVLAELLCMQPNFLVLDEPTNHMDINAKEALEALLSEYKGTQLIVSHDRYFLSLVTDSLLIINRDEVTYYPFNYEHYLEKKRRLLNQERVPGEMSAEDAALLAKLMNVPKKAPIQSRALTTEEAYRDWIMSQADEQLLQAFDCFERRMLEISGISDWDAAENELTEKCLEWYDKYLELE